MRKSNEISKLFAVPLPIFPLYAMFVNSLYTFFILLVSLVSAKADDVSFKIASVPLNNTESASVLQYDGKQLIYITKDQDALVIPLTEEERTKLRHSLTMNNYKPWSGFWANPNLVDGAFYSVQATIGDHTHQFTAINGCPPGFARITATIHQITAKPLILRGWNILENDSKQFKSFKQYQQEAFQEAKKLQRENLPN